MMFFGKLWVMNPETYISLIVSLHWSDVVEVLWEVLAEDESCEDTIRVPITLPGLPNVGKMARHFRNLLVMNIQVDVISFESNRTSCVEACHG